MHEAARSTWSMLVLGESLAAHTRLRSQDNRECIFDNHNNAPSELTLLGSSERLPAHRFCVVSACIPSASPVGTAVPERRLHFPGWPSFLAIVLWARAT